MCHKSIFSNNSLEIVSFQPFIIMNKITRFTDKFIEYTGEVISWFTLLLVILVVVDVAGRYILSESSVAFQELEWHIFSIIFLGAAAYTLKHNEHVRVDLIYSKLSETNKIIIDILGILIFLLPFAVMIVWSSYDFVERSFTYSEQSPDPGGLPFRFLIKSVLPVSFLLLILQAGVILTRKISTLIRRDNN